MEEMEVVTSMSTMRHSDNAGRQLQAPHDRMVRPAVTTDLELDEADSPRDRHMTCGDCGAAFVWTAGEQEFYRVKELLAPKRCPPCRKVRRARFEADASDRLPRRDRVAARPEALRAR